MLLQTTWRNSSDDGGDGENISDALDRAQLVAAGLRQKVPIQSIFMSPASTGHEHTSHRARATRRKLGRAFTDGVLLVQKSNCMSNSATSALQLSRQSLSRTDSACGQHGSQIRTT